MTKGFRRVICAALTAVMASSLVLEHNLRMEAEKTDLGEATKTVGFTEANGRYDFSQIAMQNFNSAVQENKEAVYETRTVIVSLSGESVLESAAGKDINEYLATKAGKKKADKVKAQQDVFLQSLSALKISYKLEDRYSAVDNAVAVEINTKYVSKIKQMAGVESVVISRTYSEPKTAVSYSSASDITNATSVYKTGIYDTSEYTDKTKSADGKDYSEGMVVAILDTGLDYSHSAFQTMPESLGLSSSELDAKLKSNAFAAETKAGKSLSAADVYVNDKVPFAYDYADDDTDVYPAYSNHGTHVAGIIGGQDVNYTDKDGNLVNEPFIGSAPNAQLVICKVFTDDFDSKDLGGAVSEDILAALEDCVYLGVDVINMSLGTSAGFSTTDDGDDEGILLNNAYNAIQEAGISLMAAASNDFSSAYGGSFGTNLTTNPDSGTIGSPSSYAAALSIASISGQKSEYMLAYPQRETSDTTIDAGTAIFYEKSSDENSVQFEFLEQMAALNEQYGLNNQFEYVVVPEKGLSSGYTQSIKRLFNESPRIALIERGSNTFQEKVEEAHAAGAIAVIVYNNVAGLIRMNLGEIDDFEPIAVSVSKEAGETLVKLAEKNGNKRIGKIVIGEEYLAGPFMSDFSSWGPTPDLGLKPEVTAHGGEITSTVPGGYGEQSGTSMATPNMAGFAAVARNYLIQNTDVYAAELNWIKEQIKAEYAEENDGATLSDNIAYNRALTRFVNQLVMSTATTAVDKDGLAYSPRKQGAGLANISSTLTSKAYLYNEDTNDARPKIEYGDDAERTGEYTMSFQIKNFGDSALTFNTRSLVMTEQITAISSTTTAVKEQAYMLDDIAPTWKIKSGEATLDGSTLVIAAGKQASIQVTVKLSADEIAYFEQTLGNGTKVFENGMYVEGFLQLDSVTNDQCDLSIPFLAFYGDWTDADMLDYTAYELAELEKAAASKEEAPKETVYATQAFTSYYNDKYILPMGGYVYLLSDYDTENNPMYPNEEYCSVSRYNEYYGEGAQENYLTSTRIQAVYAGLLRNARVVNYRLYNEATGELITADSIDRVGKAYSGGGSAVPANVKLEMYPDDHGLVENGKYRLEFDFYSDAEGMSSPEIQAAIEAGDLVCDEENTFKFSFYIDYQAPVLENVDVRYETKEVNGKEVQDIYLDFEIYDNHYPQSVMLCYVDKNGKGEDVLNLATDYITPVRNPVKNGTSKVSIEITDIMENKLIAGKGFYVQIDDYALNNCVYALDLAGAQKNMMPENFEVTNCQEYDGKGADYELTIGKYETFKVQLAYEGEADESNFTWSSLNRTIANVKNGEIVGMSEGTTTINVITKDSKVSKKIRVTVEDKGKSLPNASISFGVIKTSTLSLAKAEGYVEVNPGEEFTLDIVVDPWWYPAETLSLQWKSNNEKVATVSQNGTVNTLKEGKATIEAAIMKNGAPTALVTSVVLDVQDEFTVNSYTLQDYHGVGYNGEICACGSAFMYEELVYDSTGADTVKDNCPECGAVVSDGTKVLKIPTDMNIMTIGEGAFKDIDNVEILIIPKTVSQISERAFLDCSSIKEIYFIDTKAKTPADADLSKILPEAFYGCTTLEKLDLSNTKTFTVGTDAFYGCTNLKEIVKMENIGAMYDRAFAKTALTKVDLSGVYMSGKNVFSGCTKLTKATVGNYTEIGEGMFAGYTEYVYNATTGRYDEAPVSACVKLEEVAFVTETTVGNETVYGYAKNVDISANAFDGCIMLTKLTGMDNANVTVRSIGDEAFANTGLTSFAIPKGLRSMGGDILKGTAVTTVAIGDDFDLANLSLTGLPFSGLTVTASGGKYYSDKGVIYNAEKTKLLLVYDETQFAAMNIPATVTEIGGYAFANTTTITEIALPEQIKVIGKGAFENSALTSFTFAPSSQIEEIPTSAFRKSKLTSIILPETVKEIGDYAFAETALTSFTFAYESEEITLGNGVFADCSLLNTVTFTDNAGAAANKSFVMGNRTFEDCKELVSVTMPAVTEIGAETFKGCNKLTTVDLSQATTIGAYTFSGEMKYNVATNVYEYAGLPALSSITLGNVKEIGEFAFAGNTALTAIDLTGVEKVGAYAFAWCTNLKTLANREFVEVCDYAFYNCNSLDDDLADNKKSLTLSGVKTIGVGGFAVDNGGAALDELLLT